MIVMFFFPDFDGKFFTGDWDANFIVDRDRSIG